MNNIVYTTLSVEDIEDTEIATSYYFSLKQSQHHLLILCPNHYRTAGSAHPEKNCIISAYGTNKKAQ